MWGWCYCEDETRQEPWKHPAQGLACSEPSINFCWIVICTIRLLHSLNKTLWGAGEEFGHLPAAFPWWCFHWTASFPLLRTLASSQRRELGYKVFLELKGIKDVWHILAPRGLLTHPPNRRFHVKEGAVTTAGEQGWGTERVRDVLPAPFVLRAFHVTKQSWQQPYEEGTDIVPTLQRKKWKHRGPVWLTHS